MSSRDLWWSYMPRKRRLGEAPIVWQVIWYGDDERPIADCGHRHHERDAAFACPWEPAPLPPVGAGIVVWIRDPVYRAPGEILRDARTPREQLELALGAG